MKRVPASGEVIAEEMQEKLAESIPRDEQGELIRTFVRTIADEIAKVMQALASAERTL